MITAEVLCPGCSAPLACYGSAQAADAQGNLTLTLALGPAERDHIAAHLGAEWPPVPREAPPMDVACSWTTCTWHRPTAAPAADWNDFVAGVADCIAHLRTAHADEPSAQRLERWLLTKANEAGRAVEEPH